MKSEIVHIGFGDSAKDSIQHAIDNYGLPGICVVSRDDFTQGPLSENVFNHEARIEYWEKIGEVLSFDFNIENFYLESIQLLDGIDNNSIITIWKGNSCHDVLATYYITQYLREKTIEFHEIDLAKVESEFTLPLVNVAMLEPIDIAEIYSIKNKIDKTKLDSYRQKWNNLAKELAPYRVLINNKIESVVSDYYDSRILDVIPSDFKKVSEVIGSIIELQNHKISDVTIEINIRKLIEKGEIQYKGEMKTMHDYQIKK